MCKFNLCWGFRLIPELFIRDMHRALSLSPSTPTPRTAHYSPMLHNATLALACSYADDPVLKDIRCRRTFANKAKKYIESDCEKPTIAIITALSILAIFHSVCGEQSLAYLYLGALTLTRVGVRSASRTGGRADVRVFTQAWPAV